MKKTIHILVTVALTTAFGSGFSQHSTVAAGGDGDGNGGSVSFSVGQTSYTYLEGDENSLSEGVQQAYEIWVAASAPDIPFNLDLKAYPNPTRDLLTLEVGEDGQGEPLVYQLHAMNGTLIYQENVTDLRTAIDMSSLSSGTYLLTISNSDNNIKTFQIIKP